MTDRLHRSFRQWQRFLHTSTPPGQGQSVNEGPKTVTSSTATPITTKFVDPSKFAKCEPTFLDKTFLVWSGHYKSRADVPKLVDHEVLERTRSISRIRINLGFMVVGIAAAVVMIYSGKQAWRTGDSLESRNKEWHRQIKAEHEAAIAKAKMSNTSTTS